jgi:hypothetical protein
VDLERLVTFSRPVSATSLPEIVLVDRSALHPVALRLLETIVMETRMSVDSAAAPLLEQRRRQERQPGPNAADELNMSCDARRGRSQARQHCGMCNFYAAKVSATEITARSCTVFVHS